MGFWKRECHFCEINICLAYRQFHLLAMNGSTVLIHREIDTQLKNKEKKGEIANLSANITKFH